MARKYRRDNRGRFAGGGGGATARGGRLRTASGKKRATQTMKAGGAKAAGTIGKPKGLKPRAIKPKAAAAATKPAVKPASKPVRAKRGPMSERQKDALASAKSDLQTYKGRLKDARSNKAKAGNSLEKLKAQSRIDEHSLNVTRGQRRVTSIQARPILGKPITGPGRWGERMSSAANRNSGAIKGKIKRDKNVSSKAKGGANLNAGKYKNIYMANANKAAAKTAPTASRKSQLERGAQRSNAKAARRSTFGKLQFTQDAFLARSQRTASIRNPKVKAHAQRLYGKVIDSFTETETPASLRKSFKTAGKPKAKRRSAEQRRRERGHQDMLKLSRYLFR